MRSGTGKAAYNTLSPDLNLAGNQEQPTIHVIHGLQVILAIIWLSYGWVWMTIKSRV
jgi:hypothetical protein